MNTHDALRGLLDAIGRSNNTRRSVASSWGDRIADRWELGRRALAHGDEPAQYDSLVHLLGAIEWKALDEKGLGDIVAVADWLGRTHSAAEGPYVDARTYADRRDAGLT